MIKDEDDESPGKLITVKFYVVDCGRCNYSTTVDFVHWYHAAAKALREQGWKRVDDYGWVCPDCQVAYTDKIISLWQPIKVLRHAATEGDNEHS